MLVVATVLLGYRLIYTFDREGGLIGETKLPMHEIEPKVQGGLCTRGGVIAGLYDICIL